MAVASRLRALLPGAQAGPLNHRLSRPVCPLLRQARLPCIADRAAAPAFPGRPGIRGRTQQRSLPDGRSGSPARSCSPDRLAGERRPGASLSAPSTSGSHQAPGARPSKPRVPHAAAAIAAPTSSDDSGRSSESLTDEDRLRLMSHFNASTSERQWQLSEGEEEDGLPRLPCDPRRALEASLRLPPVEPHLLQRQGSDSSLSSDNSSEPSSSRSSHAEHSSQPSSSLDHQQQHLPAATPSPVPSEAAPSPSPPPAAAGGEEDQTSFIAGVPRPILIISFISGSLTMASCIFNTLLPIYMVTELKMSMRSMGVFEGMLEAFSYVIRMFSGVVSDMMTSRKAAITLGFAMGACAKFGMAGAGSVAHLFASKAVDRLANGVQAAPRDALISDLAPMETRSSCFGFAQSMRKWGSMTGAVLAYFLMRASNNNYQIIFYLAAAVSLASCVAFVMLVPSHVRPQHSQPAAPQQQQEQGVPAAAQQQKKSGFSLAQFGKDVMSMGPDFYRMLLIVSLYGMGHLNESLLEARAIEVGFGKAESTLVVAALAAMVFVSALPLGRLDDARGPRTTFAVGMAALALGNCTLLLSGAHPWAVFASTLFLGVHWAVIQGPMLSIVVGLAPQHLRGTAFGIFYTVMAFTAVAANTLYGSLWTAMGANAAFSLSAGLMVCTLLALPVLLPKGSPAAMAGSARAKMMQAAAKAQQAAAEVAAAAAAAAGGGGGGGKGPVVAPAM